MTEKLTDAERIAQIDPLLANGWTIQDGRDAIHKTFVFSNFIEAFGFMTVRRFGQRNGTITLNGPTYTIEWIFI